eukprot:tig00021680_g23036.t1
MGLDAELRWPRSKPLGRAQALSGHCNAVRGVAIPSDARAVFSGSSDGSIRIWRISDVALAHAVVRAHGARGDGPAAEAEPQRVDCVEACADGRLLSGGTDRFARLWDPATAQQVLCLRGHASGVVSAAASRNGRLLATGGDAGDDSIRLWDARAGGEPVLTLVGHTGSVEALAASPDGTFLVSGGWDRSVRAWDVRAARAAPAISIEGAHAGGVSAVALSFGYGRIYSASEDQMIKEWDARTGAETARMAGHSEGVTCLRLSEDGTLLVSGSWDRTLRLWSARTRAVGRVLEGHGAAVTCAALAPDATLIASGSNDAAVRLWSCPGREAPAPASMAAPASSPTVENPAVRAKIRLSIAEMSARHGRSFPAPLHSKGPRSLGPSSAGNLLQPPGYGPRPDGDVSPLFAPSSPSGSPVPPRSPASPGAEEPAAAAAAVSATA